MFAKSEKVAAVGEANIPLFGKQVPHPVTVNGTSRDAIKQYQLVEITTDSMQIAAATTIGQYAPTKMYGVAAYDCGATEHVTVFVEGTFNVNALDFTALTTIATRSADEKAGFLNAIGQAGLYFTNLNTDPVMSV